MEPTVRVRSTPFPSEPYRKAAMGPKAVSKAAFAGIPAYRKAVTFAPQQQDSAILKRIQTGDGKALTLLCARYSRLVYSVSLRILRDPTGAEDVLQEVFIGIWRSPEQLIDYGDLTPWMLVASRNRSISVLRTRRPSISSDDIVLASRYDLALHSEQNLLCEKVRELIEGLPLEQRIVVEMAYFKGMTHSEIADTTGSP